MFKNLIAASLFSVSLPGLLSAGAIENLRSSGFAPGAPVPVSLAAPLSVAAPAPDFSGRPAADPVLHALSDAQWEALLNAPTWEEQVQAEAQGANKELYGDFHVRYIIKGQVSFRTEPPTFTADTGKVFKVLAYPKWLKETGDARICVEGYARQRDNTAELVIKKMLAPDALDNLMPGADMQAMQRDPFVIRHDASGYLLGNVYWDLQRTASGERARDGHGNLLSVYESGVKVRPELLERAFFVKKNTLKPVRYGDHGMLMFTFKPGGVTAADGRSVRGLAVTLDAYYKDIANMSYSPIAALKGKYLVYYSIQSIERYSEYKLHDNTQSIQLYPLKISRAQQLRLLDNAIAKSVDNNKGEAYSLFYNSCANSALSLVNSVLEENRKIKEGWLPEIVYRVRTTFPDSIAALLLKKGLAERPLTEVTGSNYSTVYSGF